MKESERRSEIYKQMSIQETVETEDSVEMEEMEDSDPMDLMAPMDLTDPTVLMDLMDRTAPMDPLDLERHQTAETAPEVPQDLLERLELPDVEETEAPASELEADLEVMEVTLRQELLETRALPPLEETLHLEILAPLVSEPPDFPEPAETEDLEHRRGARITASTLDSTQEVHGH